MENENLELQPGQNTGVVIAPSAADWKAGAETGSFQPIRPGGDWRPHMPSGERQTAVVSGKNLLETNACMSFAALDCIEAVMNLALTEGTMPQAHRDYLTNEGYLGPDGKVNFSDRFTARMSGTTRDGNSYNGVYESIRYDGLIPEREWPFPVELISNFTTEPERWNIYYAQPGADRIAKAKRFLDHFAINYDLVRYPGFTGNIGDWLVYSPLHILTAVCPPWNTDQIIQACGLPVQHGTALSFVSTKKSYILDHYVPFEKLFAPDYPIPYAVRVRVSYLNPAEPIPPFTYDYRTNLRYGMPPGAEVKAMQQGLQTALDASGKPYMTLGTFGWFKSITKAALGRFQTDHGISDPDGQGTNFGPKSRATLTAVLQAQASGGISTPRDFGGTESAIMEEGDIADKPVTESPKFTLNFTDIWKTLRGALVTLAAVALAPVVAYIGANYAAWTYVICIPQIPCFDTSLIAIPVIGAVLELARRWLAGRPTK